MPMRRAALVAALILAATPALAADKIDLSKPWGDKDGCINRVQQEVYSEHMFLLTKDAFVMSFGTCEIKKTVVNKDGSLTLSTTCQSEDEQPVSDTLTVRRSKKDKTKITVLDGDGSAFPEDLARCR